MVASKYRMHHNRRCYCARELMDTFVRLGFPCWLCPSVLPPFPGFYHCLDRPWLCQPFLSTSEVPGLVDGTHFLCCGAQQQSSQARGVCLGCLWHQQVVAGIPVVGWLGQGGQHEPELCPEVCANTPPGHCHTGITFQGALLVGVMPTLMLEFPLEKGWWERPSSAGGKTATTTLIPHPWGMVCS